MKIPFLLAVLVTLAAFLACGGLTPQDNISRATT